MLDHQALVAEDGDAGDGVHVLLMEEVDELRHVMDVDVVLAEQRVLEGDGDAAVGIFDVEDDGVAADFAPVLDDAESVVAGGHDAGQVDGADFEVFGNGDGLFGDRGGEDSGDDELFVGFKNVGGVRFVVRGADGVGEFGGRQVGGAAEVAAGDGGDGFSALGGVDFGAGSGEAWVRAVAGLAGRDRACTGCSCAACAGDRRRFDGLGLGAEVGGGVGAEAPGGGSEKEDRKWQ